MSKTFSDNIIGTTNISNKGSIMKILDYKSPKVLIEFQDEFRYKKWVFYSQFQSGKVSNPYLKNNLGIGYVGVGNYLTTYNGKHTPEYHAWSNMLTRCYSETWQKNYDTYKKCSVCEEWHNFQNFAKWYNENYYEVEGDIMCLDKDILKKGNKLYSPETCVFVPNRINTLFVKKDKNRGEYPIGVSYNKMRKKFATGVSIDHKRVGLGYFKTPMEAFYVYKKHKENYVKKVANEFKDKIPETVYDALMRYEVSLED